MTLRPKTETDSETEDRLTELEIKFAFVEQLLGELNDALTTESARVTQLERQLEVLKGRLSAATANSPGDPRTEPPPPHY